MGRISSLNGIAGQLGSISSALLAGWLAPSLGWRGLFLFGLLPIVLVIWMILAIDDRKVWDYHGQKEETHHQPVSVAEALQNKRIDCSNPRFDGHDNRSDCRVLRDDELVTNPYSNKSESLRKKFFVVDGSDHFGDVFRHVDVWSAVRPIWTASGLWNLSACLFAVCLPLPICSFHEHYAYWRCHCRIFCQWDVCRIWCDDYQTLSTSYPFNS